jgi:hypothetical protein
MWDKVLSVACAARAQQSGPNLPNGPALNSRRTDDEAYSRALSDVQLTCGSHMSALGSWHSSPVLETLNMFRFHICCPNKVVLFSTFLEKLFVSPRFIHVSGVYFCTFRYNPLWPLFTFSSLFCNSPMKTYIFIRSIWQWDFVSMDTLYLPCIYIFMQVLNGPTLGYVHVALNLTWRTIWHGVVILQPMFSNHIIEPRSKTTDKMTNQ